MIAKMNVTTRSIPITEGKRQARRALPSVMDTRSALFGLAGAVLPALLVACGDAPGRYKRSIEDYPSETLHWTIAFGPGGGNDIMARTIIDILRRYELYPRPIVARNRAAGAGAVGWGYVFRQSGNPYHISTTSGSFITTPMFANTPWGPTSFTPVALLATDNVVLAVDRRSDVRSLEEFIERARSAAPAIGGMGTIQVDYMVSNLLARSAGFQLRYVPFNAQGELTTALLSRSIDAMVGNPAAVLGLINSGDLRALAYSGKATPAALGDVPTLHSKGFSDITISMPRGLILPPQVPLEVRDWWIGAIKQVVNTPEWQNYLAANLLTEDLRFGDDFHDYLVATSSTFSEVLRELDSRD
jgi:putative tricarboxylic transport membrane protein